MIYTIQNDCLQVSVNMAGAELHRIVHLPTATDCLWDGQADIWPRRAPIIFPVTAKLTQECYTWRGKTYPMPLHGFARDMEHELVDITPDSLRLRLVASEETKAMYPFDFTFDSVFTLDGDALHHTFEITNHTDEIMPFSTGYHSGYRCPFDDKHSIEDYDIVFEQNETAQRTVTSVGTMLATHQVDCFQNSNVIPLHDELFNLNLTFPALKSNRVALRERESGREIEIDFTGFPTLVLWSTQHKVRFVCVEPWYGMFEPTTPYGDLDSRPRMQQLPTGETFSCTKKITFRL